MSRGLDKDEPKGGEEDNTPVEPKHDQPIWQVYSRRNKGTHAEKTGGPAGNEGDRFSYSKRLQETMGGKSDV